MDYGFEELKKAYRDLGVTKGRVVLIKSDLRLLGGYGPMTQRSAPLHAHYDILAELVNLDEGTLVVPTVTTYLCNTDTPFDPVMSRSQTGVLSEFIRTRPESVRSHHAFVSYSAVGRQAEEICLNVSRHSFGPASPKDRLIERNALCISIGLEPRWTCSTIHHVEMVMGVPYRYTKEFVHPVVYPEGMRREPFYMPVWYRSLNLKRNRNVKIFKHFFSMGYSVAEAAIGRGRIYSYSILDFYKAAVDYLRTDIYGWLDEPPPENMRPFRE